MGSPIQVGGNDWDELYDYLNNINLSGKSATIATPTTEKSHTINLNDNTITDTGIGTGDLLMYNGSKVKSRPKGTALQQIRVKADGSDHEYFTPSIGSDSTVPDYNWIIYKSGSNFFAKEGDGGAVIANTINASDAIQTVFNIFMDNANMNGRIFIKNATYPIAGYAPFAPFAINLQLGNDANYLNYAHVIGESRNGVIFQNTKNNTTQPAWKLVNAKCRTRWENITMDGGNLGDATHFFDLLSMSSTNPNRAEVSNCRFTNSWGFGLFLGNNVSGFDVYGNIFDTQRSILEDVAFECDEWGFIHHNYFDRNSGNLLGSSLTSGSAHNVDIHDNIVKRTADIAAGFAISLEGWGNYSDCRVHHNDVTGGPIIIGAGGTWTSDWTFRNMSIDNNTVDGGGIRIQGRPTGGFTNTIHGLVIDNNVVHDSHTWGIYIEKVADGLTVRNNKIRNTNTSNTAGSNNGLIEMFDCSNFVVSDNDLRMLDTSNANRNPHGIASWLGTNGKIYNNHIVNLTINPSYVDWGNNTNVKFPPINADTSGATLTALETEVNELKAMCRDFGLLRT